MSIWPSIRFPFKEYFQLPFPVTSDERTKLQWVVRLRWLMIIGLISLVPVALMIGSLNGVRLFIYFALILFMVGFNFLTQIKWIDSPDQVHPGQILFQLSFDLTVLTGFLTSTSDELNPFYVLLYVNASLGASLIEGKWSPLFLVFCHQALFVVQSLSGFTATDRTAWQTFFAQHFVLIIAWGVSRSLGRHLSIQKEKLHQVRLFAEKMDRLRALGAMSAGFSHEFASPLSTVKLRLNRELKANPHSENLQEMNLAILECEAVIRQMNQAQMDPREFQFQTFNLNSATQNILNSWLIVNPEAKALFFTETHLDKVRLPLLNYSQALINLLDNAFEANGEGLIHVRVDHLDSKIVVTVENEGSTFSEDVLMRFGEPFVTTKVTGTGLGLYSVQLFAQSSGGTALISNSNRGAQVMLQFPQASIGEIHQQ